MIAQRFAEFLVVICACFLARFDVRAQTAKPPTDASSAAAGMIKDIDVHLQPNGLTIEVVLSLPFLPQGVRLTKPDRLVFDFPGSNERYRLIASD